jgi:hypothetical protein
MHQLFHLACKACEKQEAAANEVAMLTDIVRPIEY